MDEDEYREALKDAYNEARAANQALVTDQVKFLDQAVLSLAGGGLGLALTFLHDFAETPQFGWLFLCGCVSLIVSIILILLGLHISIGLVQWHMSRLDAAAKKRFSEEANAAVDRSGKMGKRITTNLNWLATLALVVGISCLALFAYNNLSSNLKGPQMSKSDGQGGSGFQKSAPPATPRVVPPPQNVQPPQPTPAPKK